MSFLGAMGKPSRRSYSPVSQAEWAAHGCPIILVVDELLPLSSLDFYFHDSTSCLFYFYFDGHTIALPASHSKPSQSLLAYFYLNVFVFLARYSHIMTI